MTRNTQQNYVKPMVGAISVPMVVFLSAFAAVVAIEGGGIGQAARLDCVVNCRTGFDTLGKHLSVTCTTFSVSNFLSKALSVFLLMCFILWVTCVFLDAFCTFWSQRIFCEPCFAFGGSTVVSAILIEACLTPCPKTALVTLVFAKLRKVKNVLAFAALFCSNGFRHDCYLDNGYCSEPVQVRTRTGSFYYTLLRTPIKLNIGGNTRG